MKTLKHKDSCLSLQEVGICDCGAQQDKCTKRGFHVFAGDVPTICIECGKDLTFSPHSKAWDWVNEIPEYEHSPFCYFYKNNAGMCDCNKAIKQQRLFDLIVKALHQTHEETVREMEGIIGEDENLLTDIESVSEYLTVQQLNMKKIKNAVKKDIRNQLRKEQRQRLAQYKPVTEEI